MNERMNEDEEVVQCKEIQLYRLLFLLPGGTTTSLVHPQQSS
jgi:hypothetical protein